ncbi:hypothetical protein A3SI_18864 [Nitritalea halalkaliphila LW7]|uniref:Uncharacterized protein n=1 Tax=Nitritalea halalkaliphila LW7 TaxID=1189621 RepID=I5BTT9_9BACT|nr:hypothetical protein A3SI_18864 [Nitritalea halalkaliphila LW7]
MLSFSFVSMFVCFRFRDFNFLFLSFRCSFAFFLSKSPFFFFLFLSFIEIPLLFLSFAFFLENKNPQGSRGSDFQAALKEQAPKMHIPRKLRVPGGYPSKILHAPSVAA